MKIGIISCQKNSQMGCAGKEACYSCFDAVNNKKGAFEQYDKVEIVGISNCGGCPGRRIKARIKLLKNECGAEKIHFSNCSFIDPKCPYIDFDEISKQISKEIDTEIVYGTHTLIKKENNIKCTCNDSKKD